MLRAAALKRPAPQRDRVLCALPFCRSKPIILELRADVILVLPPATMLLRPEELDVDSLPDTEAVFLVRAGERSAYLARTALLRRRLRRVFAGRGLDLRAVATSVECWLTQSRFESSLVHYALARQYFPDTYLKITRLRMPVYVRLALANEYPRTLLTTRLTSRAALQFGPFRTRARAEQFEQHVLDLFQLRRCQEDLSPSPAHPGCIYGEMNMCLRPCQNVVTRDEYAAEARRVADFLSTRGATARARAESAREQLSAEMNFEIAAREHKRIERIDEALAFRDELAGDVERCTGFVVAGGRGAVSLWPVWRGWLQAPVAVEFAAGASLDAVLREQLGALTFETGLSSEREEHLALLAKWFYSSWREGEWVPWEKPDAPPVRKLVRAISRGAAAAGKGTPETVQNAPRVT